MGRALEKQGKVKSLSDFETVLQLEKDHRLPEAAEAAEKLLAFSPDSLHLYLALGRIKRELAMFGESVKFLSDAKARLYDKLNDYDKNQLLNELEISQKKTVLESYPRGLGVVLTTSCNLRCVMCNSWKTEWTIPEQTVREILELIPYLKRVMWLGGEAFLCRDFELLFDATLKNPNIHQTLVTHGLLINEGWADKLSSANINLTFSIDSIKTSRYEKIRIGAKFDNLIKSLELIRSKKNRDKSSRMKTSINFVTMKSNYDEIRDMIDFAAEYAFNDLTLTPIDYVDSEENIFKHKDLSAWKKIEEQVKEVEEKAQSYGIGFHNWLPPIKENDEQLQKNVSPSENTSLQAQNTEPVFCLWPWQHMFIDLAGRVKPFCHCPKQIGNVLESTLLDIWNGQEIRNYRKLIIEKDFKNLCNDICVYSAIERESMGLSW